MVNELEHKRYFLMSSEDYGQIKKNVIDNKIWWRGKDSTKANSEIEKLAIKEGDVILFLDTPNKRFCIVAEANSKSKKADELNNFTELEKSVELTPDRLVIQLKDTLKRISFEINEENFGELQRLGLFGNPKPFKSLCGYLRSKSRGRLTKYQSQENKAFEYILNNIEKR